MTENDKRVEVSQAEYWRGKIAENDKLAYRAWIMLTVYRDKTAGLFDAERLATTHDGQVALRFVLDCMEQGEQNARHRLASTPLPEQQGEAVKEPDAWMIQDVLDAALRSNTAFYAIGRNHRVTSPDVENNMDDLADALHVLSGYTDIEQAVRNLTVLRADAFDTSHPTPEQPRLGQEGEVD